VPDTDGPGDTKAPPTDAEDAHGGIDIERATADDVELREDDDDLYAAPRDEPESASPEEIAAAREQTEQAEARLAQALKAYRALKDENEEFRRRAVRNVERGFIERRERLLLKFIEILDNLDRALAAAESAFVAEPLVEGLIAVRAQLLQALRDEGLERVPVLGLPYDPEVAEAMVMRPVDEPERHLLVLEELLRAYRFEGRVVRHGQVVVGEHQAAPGESPTDPAAA
jgi:molecular chaperone GrpE